MKLTKRSALGVTVLGAVAAGAASIVTAPAANAFVLSTNLAAGPYCVGHTYALKVNVDLTSDLLPVKFTDNGGNAVSQVPGFFATSTTFNWTPATVGNHTLVVNQDLINTTVGTVTVGSCTTTTVPPTTTTTVPPTTTTTAPVTTTSGATTTTGTPSDTGSASGILGGILSGLSSALPSGSALG
ncbi:hypothetical protein [Nocardia stercoris]|uniref:Uncharacterized protein n=1 Tax=Nocardia stercoris TaxID=2483361 RepID=A0A3M2L7I3_9NOCA|nr:hypothetical protein [Nocardia stercoris]RMI32956.1 hypothetical protein EBN03_13705 [Nocardia stercoris]